MVDESRKKHFFTAHHNVVYISMDYIYIDVMYKSLYAKIHSVREIDILYTELRTRTNKHSTNIV